MTEKILILFHKEDNDGVCSAALIHNAFIKNLNILSKDIVLRGLDYNEIASFDKSTIDDFRNEYQKLILTDISFPLNLMEYTWKIWKNDFMWFDHHEPIIKAVSFSKYVNNIYEIPGERCTDRSAILCVYKYFYDSFDIDKIDNPSKIPLLLRILSAWDSFTFEQEGFELDYVKKVNEGFTNMYDLDIDKAITIMKDLNDLDKYIDEAYKIGSILCEYEKKVYKSIIKNVSNCDWKVIDTNGIEHTACCFVGLGKSNSLMFSTVKDKVECGIIFKMNKDNNWTISLYNTDNNNKNFHCGKFMKEKYGGGGHQGAAGCQITQDKAFELLRMKTI